MHHFNTRKRRIGGQEGSALAEMICLLPIYAIILSMDLFLGRYYTLKEKAEMAARYTAWKLRRGTKHVILPLTYKEISVRRLPSGLDAIPPDIGEQWEENGAGDTILQICRAVADAANDTCRVEAKTLTKAPDFLPSPSDGSRGPLTKFLRSRI